MPNNVESLVLVSWQTTLELYRRYVKRFTRYLPLHQRTFYLEAVCFSTAVLQFHNMHYISRLQFYSFSRRFFLPNPFYSKCMRSISGHSQDTTVSLVNMKRSGDTEQPSMFCLQLNCKWTIVQLQRCSLQSDLKAVFPLVPPSLPPSLSPSLSLSDRKSVV